MSGICKEAELTLPNQAADKSYWRVVGASVAGTSHLRVAQPCQDSFQYKLLPSGEVVIAVSDGAGSATKAAEGSALAVQTAITSVEKHLTTGTPTSESDWQAVVQASFLEVRTALVQQASTEEASLRDYAATLMLVILTKGWTIGGSVGDCAAVVLNEADSLSSLCRPQIGEYANTTNFLTQLDALERLDIQIRTEPVQGVAVFSDGLSKLALNIAQNKPYPPFFKPLFAFAATTLDEQEAKTQLKTFLDSERVNARTDDDKTLVLACRMASWEAIDAST